MIARLMFLLAFINVARIQRGMRRVFGVLTGCLAATAVHAAPIPITSFDYHIAGTFLQVTPATLSVPKSIAGSVEVSVFAGGSTNNPAVAKLTQGAYVQAILRGPAFPTPQTIVASPNGPLILPPINLVGQYELDNIALIDQATGQVRMEGSPSTVPVNVFDQLLISTVTSTPMTLDQIQQAGIDIDESSFNAVQFNITFVVAGQTIPVSFPVVSPTFTQSTELIPADEISAQLTQAAAINRQISSTMVTLPPQLQTAGLNIQLQGINFQETDPGPGQSLNLPIPPIPALMVIPGSIGYLHEFFDVEIFTENGAPLGSGLSVGNIEATLDLPPGPDGIVSTNWATPGDDPLRFARIGPNDVTQPTQPIVDPGPSGSENITTLQPGETGQANFYVEGLQEGLSVMNVNLTGTLYGLAAGPVGISGSATGSVLVRNPSFSITFTHPDVVRTGEPYIASVTLLNTGLSPANLVQVTLNKNSISGAVLASNQPQTIVLGTIPSGGTATATYHMVSETTGQIEFSDLTTSDASLTGQFQFSLGVDAQGVPLSPDTIAMPDFVTNLPPDLVEVANIVLGEALSIATAPKLPPGIATVGNAIITRRVLDLAEAGQRVEYGDPMSRVLPDLLRDWQGGRVTDDGFDSLLRTSQPGAQWRAVIMRDMEATDGRDDAQRAMDRAEDLAGLGQQFVLASANAGQLWVTFSGATNTATWSQGSEAYCGVFWGTNGNWGVTPDVTNEVFNWTFTNGVSAADLVVLLVNTNGQAEQLRWQISNPLPTATYSFAPFGGGYQLEVDTNSDGTIDKLIAATATQVDEVPPTLVAVQQDLGIVSGRPSPACVGPNYGNYGTVIAVVYSKPMTQASAGSTNSYSVDGNNYAYSIQIQPSGRVALMNLHRGVSAIIPRKMTITGVTDVRGNSLVAAPTPIQCLYPGTTKPFTGGVAVQGRVLLGSGAPAVNVPVTLTMYDGLATDTGCMQVVVRVSQVLTDTGGNYSFDYVMSGIPYSISASDTTTLSTNALALIMSSIISTQPDSTTLQNLINSSSNPGSLLGLLAAGTIDQAVAIVQGLDRAVVNDSVPLGSGREGQTVPIILQFRGRGSVTGQIVAADGVTPVPNAAVNLYPDPSSMELGRGMFSDGTGSFSFPGIPLGVFSIQVATSDQRGATVLGDLSAPGETTNVIIALPNNPVLYASMQGTVYDSDNITPIPNATVYVGKVQGATVQGVVSITTTDVNGDWQATNLPVATWDVAAVTRDGTRDGFRQGIALVADQPAYVDVSLQAATTVHGQVQFDNGQPVPNALVAGGQTLVYTDGNGNFQLQGVPVGSANISAGLQANPAAGIPFTRLGSTSATIVAGTANYVVVKLNAAGQIYGKVFDAQGNVKANIEVAIPDPEGGGFYYTQADGNGNYSFPNIGLGGYTISAPANATAPSLNESQLSAQLSSGDESQILAAYQEAVTVFVGAEDPLINGDDLNFAPSAWGYTTANVNYDGANVEADIHFIPQGTVSGKVLNGQNIPIGAEVELTGIGPDSTGAPVMTVRGTVNSDPASGQFGFTNALLAGPWGLQAASPFYPSVIQTNGFTTILDLNASGIVLKFPPVNDVNGSIAGYVFNPDGSSAGSNVEVHISVASNYQIETDSNGFFNTQTEFPAVNASYEVDALNPSTGLQGRNFVAMTPGITNFVNVNLLSRDATLQVKVVRADGGPASGATLEVDMNSFPFDEPIYGTADTNGLAVFPDLWTGSYSVIAQYTEGSTKLMSRGGTSVASNEVATVTLTMGATGSIEGHFYKQDGVTPVVGANVRIGGLGLASTSTNGFFEFVGVPLGTYPLSSSDPVTGANAVGSATVGYNGQIANVNLIEASLGTINGFVLDPFSSNFVANASVNISFSDGLTPGRTVTTGPNGSFSFPASPLGAFSLSASYVLPGTGTLKETVSGEANGVLSLATNTVSVTIQLQPLSDLLVQVYRPDGVTPAQNTIVTVNGSQQFTSTNGTAFFNNLAIPGTYNVRAVSQEGGDLYDGTQTNVTLRTRGATAIATLVLPGVGYISGKVVESDGVSPVNNADVTFLSQNSIFGGTMITALTSTNGLFAFDDVPLGPYSVSAFTVALAAGQSGTLSTNGQTNGVVLQLGASGTVMGKVVRADNVTPVSGEDVLIQFNSQSSNPGRAVYLTGLNGFFEFTNVPIGPFQISSAAAAFDGLINISGVLATNGEVLNLGVIPYDESFPAVAQVSPTNDSIGVSISNVIQLVFNKPLESNSVSATGILLQDTNGYVPETVSLSNGTNGPGTVVTIKPDSPLQSLTSYSVIVLSGVLYGATGGEIGSGPTDLYGRALAVPFESDFITADQTPPVLISQYPTNGQVQVPVATVPRLVFSKSLNPSNIVFHLTGPNGPVAGTVAVGINGQVLTFEPTVDLLPNLTYSMVVSNVHDLAGNYAVGQPYTATFASLVTVGPSITSLQIASNAIPFAGATIPVVAVLNTNKPGDTVAFSQNFNAIGTASNAPYQILVTLPLSGSTTIRAIPTDQYGNSGQYVALTIPVQFPSPPTVSFLGTFDDGLGEPLRTNFWNLTQTTPGLYSSIFSNGMLELAKVPNVSNPGGLQSIGPSLIVSNLSSGISGDFSAQVLFTNAVLAGPGLDQAQLNISFADGSFFLDVLQGDGEAHVWTGVQNGTTAYTNHGGMFTISRTGSVLTGYINNTAMFSELNTNAVSTIFLTLQNNQGSQDPIAVDFYGFSLVGPSIQSKPVPAGSLVRVGVEATTSTALSNFTAVVGGSASGSVVSTNVPTLTAIGYVAPTADPYDPVQVFAQAIDALGQSSGQAVLTLPVVNTTPPTLALLNLTNNFHPTGSTLKVTSLVSDVTSNVTLSLTVSGVLSNSQTVALVLTPNVVTTNVITVPLTPAPTNGGEIILTITASDAAGDFTSVSRDLWLPGTPGPQIASLVIGSNQPPVGGLTVPIVAQLASPVVGDTVLFTQNGAEVGIATNAPYQVLITLPQSGSTTISAVATDPFGNVGNPANLAITVHPNVQPSIQFAQVLPASGAVRSGSEFEINVLASGNSGLFDITETVTGPASGGTQQVEGTNLLVSGYVSSTAVVGQNVVVTAQAVDGLGQSSGAQVFHLPISDGTPPSVALLSPPNDAELLGTNLPLSVAVSDNSSSVTLTLSVSNATYFASRTQAVALTPNTLSTNVISVALPPEPTNGAPVVATVTATDQAGNATTLERLFWFPGIQTTVVWDRQALGQSIQCTNGDGSYNWPNDNNWSQSQVLGVDCGGETVAVQPSNWSTTNYPNGTNLDVVLGSVGGAPANLDVSVALHSLTIQADGGLTMNNGTSMSAVDYYFQGDGSINVNSYNATLNIDGGTMEKAAGTNTSGFGGGLSMNSYGGTFVVDSGTLALPTASYFTNGAFDVSSNATLALVPSGQSTIAGTFTGSGQGTVSLSAGALNAAASGVTFDLPDPMFQWTGGFLGGGRTVTNSAAVTVAGSSTKELSAGTLFVNAGMTRQTGSGTLSFKQFATLENLPGAVYDFASDAIVSSDDYAPQYFDNYGLVRKSAGTNGSAIDIVFNNIGGSIEVDQGTLTLANNGSSSNGTITVAAGADLELTGGQNPTWAGVISGQGGGAVHLSNGSISAKPEATLEFPQGLFQWTGGTMLGTIYNSNAVTLSGGVQMTLGPGAVFNSDGLVQHVGAGGLDLRQYARFENLPQGEYDAETNSRIYSDDYAPQNFDNFGLFHVNVGTSNAFVTSVSFNNLGGAIDVESGTLILANSGSSSNAMVTVAPGATLDLTGGQGPKWAGLMEVTGGGTVQVVNGTLYALPKLVLNASNGMFHWNGGTISGLLVNSNVATLSAPVQITLANSTVFSNFGVLVHSGLGGLDLRQYAHFENPASGLYDMRTNSRVYSDDYEPQYFDNFGVFRSSAGTNSAAVQQVVFNNLGGTVDVESGLLTLANNGLSSNATLTVATGATLDITGAQAPTWTGQIVGQGAGTIVLANGTLIGKNVVFNFTNNLFQWKGGALTGNFLNKNVFNVAGSGGMVLANSAFFTNAATVRQIGSGSPDLKQYAHIENLPGALYDLQANSGIYSDDYEPQYFDNFGLFRKSGGTNSAVSQVLFNNYGGTIDVESGNLTLNNNGYTTNGAITVAAGASVDVSGGQNPTWAGTVVGRGAGLVNFAGGTLKGNPSVTLDFTNGMLQWTGGTFIGTFVNSNVLQLAGAGTIYLANSALLNNAVLTRHTGNAGLNLRQYAHFENLASGTYNFESDGRVYTDDYSPQYFDNFGLVRKSGGTNTSSISVNFNNQGGSIEVDSGTLSLGNSPYAQGSGALAITLSGTNSGQSGSLSAGAVTLGGPLTLNLATNYTPPVGARFLIVAGSSITGTFSTLNVPGGISIVYSANQVVAEVTSPVINSVGSRSSQPSVAIKRIGNTTALQWNATTNFTIESSSEVGPNAVWRAVTNLPLLLSNDVLQLDLPSSNNSEYFRLRKN